jgi:hypothetical protein
VPAPEHTPVCAGYPLDADPELIPEPDVLVMAPPVEGAPDVAPPLVVLPVPPAVPTELPVVGLPELVTGG